MDRCRDDQNHLRLLCAFWSIVMPFQSAARCRYTGVENTVGLLSYQKSSSMVIKGDMPFGISPLWSVAITSKYKLESWGVLRAFDCKLFRHSPKGCHLLLSRLWQTSRQRKLRCRCESFGVHWFDKFALTEHLGLPPYRAHDQEYALPNLWLRRAKVHSYSAENRRSCFVSV